MRWQVLVALDILFQHAATLPYLADSDARTAWVLRHPVRMRIEQRLAWALRLKQRT